MLSKQCTSRRLATAALACLTAALLAGCMSMGPKEPAGERLLVEGERAVPERAARGFAAARDAMAAEDWLSASLELETLIENYPQFPGPYVNLAIVYRMDGRPDEAIAMLEAALAVDPEFAPANNELGVMLRKDGEFEAAAAAYRQALAGDADYAPAHYNLGILLELYMDEKAEALTHYRRYQALLSEPDQQIERWIVDLERRVPVEPDGERLAQGDAP